VPAEKLKAFGGHPARPEVREAVVGIMRDLTGIYMELGAVHQQIGRFYRYEESLDPVNFELLRQIRRLVDPQGIINPGSLGLG
jgi:D-lactate dehydrogenase (cytochrome)